MEILGSGDLFSFFYDRINDAQTTLGTDVEEETEFYLVNLMCQFQRTPKLVECSGKRVDDRPLAIRLLQTRHANPARRFTQLKHLADSTLYRMGFFAESLRRSTVDLNYYAGVGESAYDGLARMEESPARKSGPPVFRELADRFRDCVELLTEMRDDPRSDKDLLQLYEQWMAFGDTRALRRLRSMGVLPLQGDGGRSVH